MADKRYEKVKGEVPNDTHSVDLQTRVAARRVRMTNAIDRYVCGGWLAVLGVVSFRKE